MRLETRMNPMFWGNIVVGGLIGSTTDGVSGAVYEYSPSQYMVTLEPDRTGSLDGPLKMSRVQKAKEFIVIGYNNILNDLGRGEGPHLSSLLMLLNIPAEGRKDSIIKIRALSEMENDIPKFANHVIELYL